MLPSGLQDVAHKLSKRLGSIENKAAEPISPVHTIITATATGQTDRPTHTFPSLSVRHLTCKLLAEPSRLYLLALSDESIAADLIAERALKTHNHTHTQSLSVGLITNCDVWLCVRDHSWRRSQDGSS